MEGGKRVHTEVEGGKRVHTEVEGGKMVHMCMYVHVYCMCVSHVSHVSRSSCLVVKGEVVHTHTSLSCEVVCAVNAVH